MRGGLRRDHGTKAAAFSGKLEVLGCTEGLPLSFQRLSFAKLRCVSCGAVAAVVLNLTPRAAIVRRRAERAFLRERM
eukprot:216922-Pleurochrysis_carterae.AAC.4